MVNKLDRRDEFGESKLFSAISDCDLKKASKLLQQGADPNIPDNNGTTPLMDAASGGDLQLVKLLLDHQADPHLLDYHGDNAIDYAIAQDFTEVADFLQQHADSEKVNDFKKRFQQNQEERKLEVSRMIEELPEQMDLDVWYLFVEGEFRGIGQSEEQVRGYLSSDEDADAKVEKRRERLGVVKGVRRNWGTDTEPAVHVSWECPACGEIYDTDLSENVLNPALWFCEQGYGDAKFLVRWN